MPGDVLPFRVRARFTLVDPWTKVVHPANVTLHVGAILQNQNLWGWQENENENESESENEDVSKIITKKGSSGPEL